MLPAGATRVAVRVTASDGVGFGELSVHRCGHYDRWDPVLIAVSASVVSALALQDLDGGTFCVTSTAPTHLIVDLEGYEAPDRGGLAYIDTLDKVVATGLAVPAGTTVPLMVGGVGAVPAGAGAVSIGISVTGSSSGYLTVFACDQARPLASVLTHDPRRSRSSTAAIGVLAADGRLCLYGGAADLTVEVTVFGYWALGATPTAVGPVQFAYQPVPAPGLVAVAPHRLLDTRDQRTPVAGGTAITLDLSHDLPATATDIVLNATVTEPVAAGYLTVYPCDTERPTASNLNFVAGQTIPNAVTVSVGRDAHVCLFVSVTAHVVVDEAGWFEVGDGAGFVPQSPRRLLDTRDAGGPVPAGTIHVLDLSRTIAPDATAVAMNVTATEPAGTGFVTVYPCNDRRPTASNLNLVTGRTTPNLVTVAVGADHQVCFYTSQRTHLVADLAGWYTPSSLIGYVGLVPERTFDTRLNGAPVAAGGEVRLRLGDGDGPAGTEDAIAAVLMNITAVQPAAAGYVTVHPCATGRPTASNLNYDRDDVVPNLVLVQTDQTDEVCVFTQQQAHLVGDLSGFFTELPFLFPIRLT